MRIRIIIQIIFRQNIEKQLQKLLIDGPINTMQYYSTAYKRDKALANKELKAIDAQINIYKEQSKEIMLKLVI